MLRDLSTIKSEIMESYSRVAELAGEIGDHSLRLRLVEERLPRLVQDCFNLVVLGEFNSGKTTLVNALLGKPILPIGATPTTAAIHQVSWAEQPCATAVMRDGGREPIPFERLSSFSVEGGSAGEVLHVELGYPSPLLNDHVVLVDTPGVNDLNRQRAEITYGYVTQSDAILFVLDAGQVLKQSERLFLTERLLKASREKVFFIVNKMDLLTASEREEVLGFVSENLATLVPSPIIYGVSSTMALLGEENRSGLPDVVEALSRFLSDERGRVLLDNAITDLEKANTSLERHLALQGRALSMDERELDHKIAILEDEVRFRNRRIAEQDERIAKVVAELVKSVVQDLASFASTLRHSLPHTIETAPVDHIRMYLADYIQDLFRQWAEKEGDFIAEKLDVLAEETIAIVDAEIRATRDELYGELGLNARQVDLRVDTMYNDMGVLAVAGVGIGVFALSSMLVGGLLFAAAPILALVLREKAREDVRKKALEIAPAAVTQAEVAVQTKFVESINEFGTKLTAFMAAASEEARRGILDVLAQVRHERREAQFLRSEAEVELENRRSRLATVRDTLAQLREQVWESNAC